MGVKMDKKKIALFSVPLHENLGIYAKWFLDNNWEIIATKEAAEFLSSKGLEVVDVSNFVGITEDYGVPPTLHPKIEKALTTKCDYKIDLVYDIPYGLEVGNDVGGRTLLALAVKGNRIPVMNPEDMEKVIVEMKKGEIKPDTKNSLQLKTNLEIGNHFLSLVKDKESEDIISVTGTINYDLLEGENPYQQPASLYDSYKDDLGLGSFKQLSGNKPCFTNLADLDSINNAMVKLQLALDLNGIKGKKVVIAAKHGNPCGIGASDEPKYSIRKALWGNPKGIWGGEVITNFPIDEILAESLRKSSEREEKLGNAVWMLDVIAAPSISGGAIKILSTNPNRKLFFNKAIKKPFIEKNKHIKQVRGGFLVEPIADYILDLNNVNWILPSKGNEISFIIAWVASYTSFHGGNEVAIAKDDSLLSVGGGPSTYDAAMTAVARCKEQGHDIKDSFFCADAFFPFTDVPEILVKAGCKGGLVPGGGKREKDVVKFFKNNKMLVGLIPPEYRGFCKH